VTSHDQHQHHINVANNKNSTIDYTVKRGVRQKLRQTCWSECRNWKATSNSDQICQLWTQCYYALALPITDSEQSQPLWRHQWRQSRCANADKQLQVIKAFITGETTRWRWVNNSCCPPRPNL